MNTMMCMSVCLCMCKVVPKVIWGTPEDQRSKVEQILTSTPNAPVSF